MEAAAGGPDRIGTSGKVVLKRGNPRSLSESEGSAHPSHLDNILVGRLDDARLLPLTSAAFLKRFIHLASVAKETG